ncbi:hypothetical protein MRB53_001001 [Persea americana]|uniref:Uncharacterized protein n=1 Tax=Persea americana TaxID=3435 RepID=A0ACC2MQQ8_PERAE|nr:hypothetical protein MRB53_001001 [Persea americana]
MRVLQVKVAFWALWALLLVGLCWCTDESVVVVGVGECVDCAQKSVKSSDAFSGLGVTIDCKIANGKLKTRGAAKLTKDGEFQVTLPSQIVNNGGIQGVSPSKEFTDPTQSEPNPTN